MYNDIENYVWPIMERIFVCEQCKSESTQIDEPGNPAAMQYEFIKDPIDDNRTIVKSFAYILIIFNCPYCDNINFTYETTKKE